jgi:alpha-2-macroglobulin
MKKFLRYISFCILFSKVSAQNLNSSLKTSRYKYLFKLENQENKRMFDSKNKDFDVSFLHTLVDSISINKPLPSLKNHGNYVWVYASQNRLNYHRVSNIPFNIEILKNKRDLSFTILDYFSKPKHIQVNLDGKELKWNQTLNKFQTGKHKKAKLLSINYEGQEYWFKIKDKFPSEFVIAKNKLLFQTPLKFISFPLRNLKQNIKYKQWRSIKYSFSLVNWIRKIENKRNYKKDSEEYTFEKNSLLIINKPKYKLKDTVFFKAILLNQKNKYFSPKVLNVYLKTYDPKVQSIKMGKVEPYKQGFYEGNFILSDSLRLKNGTFVYLSIGESPDVEHLNTSFKFEEYELVNQVFDLKFSKELYSKTDSVELILSSKDDNDLPILDAKARIRIFPNKFNDSRYPKTIIQDTIWTHEVSLDASGKTKINIPTNLLEEIKMGIRASVDFVSSENRISYREAYTLINKAYNDSLNTSYLPLSIKIQTDSIVAQTESGKPSVATLYELIKNDTIRTTEVNLPFRKALSPAVTSYILKNNIFTEHIDKNTIAKPITLSGERTLDSVFLYLENPHRTSVWVEIYKKNKKIFETFTQDHWVYNQPSRERQLLTVVYHYLWFGNIISSENSLTFADKTLKIETDLPEVLPPGSSREVTFSVKDAHGKPIEGVDITAFSLSSKFKNSTIYRVPDFSRVRKGRKIYNAFDLKKENYSMKSIKLDYSFFKKEFKLDTGTYYKFVYPESGYFFTEMPLKNKREYAPFILKDGEIQTIQTLYIDEIPVYFNASKNSLVYSFSVKQGLRNIKIRTKDHIIYLKDSVSNNSKKIVSLDVNNLGTKAVVIPSTDKATELEKKEMHKYIMEVSGMSYGAFRYIKNDNKFFMINESGQASKSIGPLLSVESDYKNLSFNDAYSFKYKGGYQYEFEKDQVTLSPKNIPKIFKYLNQREELIHLLDSAYTETSLKEKYESQFKSKLSLRPVYDFPKFSGSGKGRIEILNEPRSSNLKENYDTEFILIFNDQDPNFIRVYPGNNKIFHDLKQGNYTLLFLFKNQHWAEEKAILVKANASSVLKVEHLDIKEQDERILKIYKNVFEKVYQYGYKKEQEIKEQYYQTTNLNLIQGRLGYVNGLIKDLEGEPIPGAQILIKGTNKGTATKADGSFSLEAPANSVLIIASIGYNTQEILINRDYYEINLEESVNHLDEVVVKGFGVEKKSNMTAAVAVVSEGLLSGRAAGVSIKIRGVSSTEAGLPGASPRPLIIRNGKPFYGELSEEDKNIMIFLSGETAIHIYGAQAKNGVILIGQEAPQNLDDIQVRKDFKDYGYWLPKIQTDKNGIAKVSIKFPDDITTWKSQFIAYGPQMETGIGQKNTKIFKSLAVELIPPRYLIQGDSLSLIAKVKNYSSDSVILKTQFEINGEKQLSTDKSMKAFLTDSAIIKAHSHLDSFKIKYSALSGKDSDAEVRNIPILKQGSLEHTGSYKFMGKDSSLNFTPIQGYNTRIQIYNSWQDILLEELNHVVKYAYNCNEQMASKLLARIYIQRIKQSMGEIYNEKQEIEKLIKKLEDNQNTDGSWSWWGKSEGIPWVSDHVAMALEEAKKTGYSVNAKPRFTFTSLDIFNFSNLSNSQKLSYLEEAHKSNAAFLEAKWLDKYSLEKISKIDSIRYHTLRFKMGLDYDRKLFSNYIQKTMLGGLYFSEKETDYQRPYISDFSFTAAMYKYYVSVGVGKDTLNCVRRYFAEKDLGSGRLNTYSAIAVVSALMTSNNTSLNTEKSKVEILYAEKKLIVDSFPFSLDIKETSPISIKKYGPEEVFLSVKQSYWNTKPKKTEGKISIETKFKEEKPIGLKAGYSNELLVNVSLKETAHYFMIEVPIPAGCRMPQSLISGSPYQNAYFREVFKDKVCFYFNSLRAGNHNFSIPLDPGFKGKFTQNPAKAELMYFPFIFGRDSVKIINIY